MSDPGKKNIITDNKFYDYMNERLKLNAMIDYMSEKKVPQHSHSIFYYLGGLTLF
ncbi:MAG: hypothetical protein GY865_02440, partial [candidate division Zixibacteria bacterium]|nr:hypothetical protein [candidate division Zixibacteria bacterium]